MPRILVALLLLLFAPAVVLAQPPSVTVEIEAGPAWQSKNAVEIPNDGSATRFSLVDILGSGPWPGGRIYVTWNLAERHGIRALLAPLSITETGVATHEIRFAGVDYAPSRETTATYRFNSYRLSYRFRLFDGGRATGWVGATM